MRDEGHLADEAKQDVLRAMERKLRAQELTDLEAILKTPQGRRLYYRIVFELCGVESESFEPAIKDGIAAAQHTARNEGRRRVGITLMQEVQEHYPHLWLNMLQEVLASRAIDLEQRKKVTET